MLEIDKACTQMAHTAQVIVDIIEFVDEAQLRWKPAPHRWSMLEVLNHLSDEEKYDFRTRLEILLQGSGAPWPPIDPEAWVSERRYNEQDPKDSLERFKSERAQSLSWLRTIESPRWANAYEHPQLGTITAGSMFVSWVAHDVLHIRQLAGLHYANLARVADPHSPRYAGAW